MSAAGAEGATASALVARVEGIAGVRVVCVGDLMLDRYVYGAVRRISPEAPIPVLGTQRESLALGGVGNVARNLRGLGAAVTVVSVVGDDAEGEALRRLLETEAIDLVVPVDAARPTSLKTRFVADGQQMLRVDRESTDALDAAMAARLAQALEVAAADAQAIVVSDYAKGVATPSLLDACFEIGRARRVPVLVDPKGGDYARYAGASVLTPNRVELEAAVGSAVASDDAAERACRALIDAHGFQAILATRGADGMSLATAEDCRHLRTEAREVFDVSGAGDTVIASLAAARAAGAELEEAARIANTCAGLVVGKAGTASVGADEVIEALQSASLSASRSKLVSLERAAQRVGEWRARGLRVGFTNGCFDLVHPGHLSLLNQAADACDRLIVALNTDASVRRLKGEERPIQNEGARAAVLASLEVVDAVVLFDGDTPLPEIEALAPDVLVKGADYSEDEVVGADVVKASGGRVLLAKLAEGFSTSGTIASIGRSTDPSKPAE